MDSGKKPLSDPESIARISRGRKRASTQPSPSMGRSMTPFGPATLTHRSRGKGGSATTNAKDYPGSTKLSVTDGSYEQLLERAEPDTLRAVATASRNESMRPGGSRKLVALPDINNHDQRRIAAHLHQIGRAEKQRDPVAPKPMRGALEEAAKEANPKKRKEIFFDNFPQGAPAKESVARNRATGARAFLSIDDKSATKRARSVASHRAAAEVMSDSSDDETQQKPSQPKTKYGL